MQVSFVLLAWQTKIFLWHNQEFPTGSPLRTPDTGQSDGMGVVGMGVGPQYVRRIPGKQDLPPTSPGGGAP